MSNLNAWIDLKCGQTCYYRFELRSKNMSRKSNDNSADMEEFLANIVCPSDDSTTRVSCIPRQKTMTCQKIKMEGKEFTIEDICQILRNNVGIILDPRPRNKHQNMLHKRISSLERWNGRTMKTISNMDIAMAGFYYEKSIDCLRCFHCLVILPSRGTRTDIWEEHAEIFPFCGHVRQCKGDTFIESVLTQSNELELCSAVDFLEEGNESANGHCSTTLMKHDNGASFVIDNNIKSPIDLKSIVEENTQMSNNILCKVCLAEQCSIIIIPCSHFAVCGQCITALENCPLCRSTIKGTIRAQLA